MCEGLNPLFCIELFLALNYPGFGLELIRMDGELTEEQLDELAKLPLIIASLDKSVLDFPPPNSVVVYEEVCPIVKGSLYGLWSKTSPKSRASHTDSLNEKPIKREEKDEPPNEIDLELITPGVKSQESLVLDDNLNQRSTPVITHVLPVKVEYQSSFLLKIMYPDNTSSYWNSDDSRNGPPEKIRKLREVAQRVRSEWKNRLICTVRATSVIAIISQSIPSISRTATQIFCSLKPVLVYYNDGSIELQYKAGFVLDRECSQASNVNLKLMAQMLQDTPTMYPETNNISPSEFLAIITRSGCKSGQGLNIHPIGLLSTLLPYQMETVEFCLGREGKSLLGPSSVGDMNNENKDKIFESATGWRKIKNTEYWVNPYSLATSSTRPPSSYSGPVFHGVGVLAEEMGLGKTMEVISLILLNRFDPYKVPEEPKMYDHHNNLLPSLINIKATLVVAPDIVAYQWYQEIERHAPNLDVLNITKSTQIKVDRMAEVDVVIIPYSLVSSQLEAALFQPMRRPTRYNLNRKVAESFKSDLVKVRFWRIVLDEVQTIKSGVNNAARVAKVIPRVHAWCVSGTPVQGSLNDIKGILIFLNLQPFVEDYAWRKLISSKADFTKVMSPLCIRHTKAQVSDQISIPKQYKRLILLQFINIERWKYDKLEQEFHEDNTRHRNLYQWFRILEQSCCASIQRVGTTLTIVEAQKVLIEEQKAKLLSSMRNLINSKSVLGQLLDKADRIDEAIALWLKLNEEIDTYLQKQVSFKAIENNELDDTTNEMSRRKDDIHENDVDFEDQKGNSKEGSLDLLHRNYFFLGTGFFRASQRMRLKLNSEELKSRDTENRMAFYSAQERKYYLLAEGIRKRILKDKIEDANCVIPKLKTSAFEFFDDMTVLDPSKFTILLRLSDIKESLLKDEARLIKILTLPLIEEEFEETKPGVQTEKDAYLDTLDAQEEAHQILENMQTSLKARERSWREYIDMVSERSGVLMPLIKKESANTRARYSQFMNAYNQRVKFYKSLQDLSDQVADIDETNNNSGKNDSADNENRVEENQQLGSIPIAMNINSRLSRAEKDVFQRENELRESESRVRYVSNLDTSVHNYGDSNKMKVCVICQDEYVFGGIGKCGHDFCYDCLSSWVHRYHNCPLCKSTMVVADIIRFETNAMSKFLSKSETSSPEKASYVGQIRVSDIKEELQSHKSVDIYEPISKQLAENINEMKLKLSHGAKIDTIARHILYLRSQDPTVQIIIFSQWQQLFIPLKRTLEEDGITVAAGEGTSQAFSITVNKFRTDTSIACLMLHSKQNVAGLTLTNATHVILCEPMLNTPFELQAISRVNRIGQTKETTVWQFCIEDTIEQAILGYTTKKRLQSVDSVGSKSAESLMLENAISGGPALDKKSGVELIDNSILRHLLDKRFAQNKPRS